MSRYVDDVEMFGCGKADCVKIPEESYFLTRKLFTKTTPQLVQIN